MATAQIVAGYSYMVFAAWIEKRVSGGCGFRLLGYTRESKSQLVWFSLSSRWELVDRFACRLKYHSLADPKLKRLVVDYRVWHMSKANGTTTAKVYKLEKKCRDYLAGESIRFERVTWIFKTDYCDSITVEAISLRSTWSWCGSRFDASSGIQCLTDFFVDIRVKRKGSNNETA